MALKRAARRTLVALAALLAIGAIAGAFAAPASAQGEHTFSGVVRDRDGHPLANQWVALSGAPFGTGEMTGGDGAFSITAPTGVYTLSISGNNFTPFPGADVPQAPSSYGLSGPQIDLGSGDVQRDLTLPTVNLDVNVVDPDGNAVPYSYANVLQTQASMPGMPPFTTGSVSASVDLYPGGTATGYYSAFAGADGTGRARLVLFASSNLSVFASPPFGSTFAASTTEIGSVTADTSVTVRLSGTHMFSGTLRDGNGQPLANQQVSLGCGLTGAGATTASDGTFVVHAPPAVCTLNVSGSNFGAPGSASGEVPSTYSLSGPQIDLSNGDVQQDLTVRSFVLDIAIVDPDGNPVPGSSAMLVQEQTAPMPGMPPFLTSLIDTSTELYPGGNASGYFGSSAVADSTGHARLVLFGGDNFKVMVYAPVGSPFASTTQDVGSVSSDRSITVHLGGTHTFTGTLRDRDGQPLANQQVTLSGNPFSVGAPTGTDGTFTIHAAAGVYTLGISGYNVGSAAQAPGGYSLSGPQIDLTNGDVHQDLTLPTVNLDVTLLDSSGSPVPNSYVSILQEIASPMPGMPPFFTGSPLATVELYPGGSASGSYTAFAPTDVNGHARLVLFPSSNLTVSASFPNRTPMTEEIGDVTHDMSITIPPNTRPRDTSPPSITPQITGTQGTGDWYTSDVTVTWSVADPESGVASTSGCDATTISQDTAGTTLTCSATNGDGVAAQQSVTVKRDATPPQISGAVTPSTPDGSGGWYVTAPQVTFTCSDATSLVARCTAGDEAGPSKTLGESASAQAVVGRAVDGAGNSATATVAGLRVDLTDPLITCGSAPTFLLGEAGAQVTATVTDAASGPVAASLTNTVATAAVGTFTTSFTGRDNAGRTSTQACSYNVVYNWSGFFAPVAAGANAAQGGSAVPMKFSLNGNHGLGVIAAGYPRSQQVACDSGAAIGTDAAAETPGASSLSYDATSDTYTWVWKTEAAWAGTCRRFILKVDDGTTHTALFKFG